MGFRGRVAAFRRIYIIPPHASRCACRQPLHKPRLHDSTNTALSQVAAPRCRPLAAAAPASRHHSQPKITTYRSSVTIRVRLVPEYGACADTRRTALKMMSKSCRELIPAECAPYRISFIRNAPAEAVISRFGFLNNTSLFSAAIFQHRAQSAFPFLLSRSHA